MIIEVARLVRPGWHYVSMTAGQWWHHLSVWAARQGQPPSHVLVLATGQTRRDATAAAASRPVARTRTCDGGWPCRAAQAERWCHHWPTVMLT